MTPEDGLIYGYEAAEPGHLQGYASSESGRQDSPSPPPDSIDYGYEEHAPSPRKPSDFFTLPSSKSLGAPPCRRGSFCTTEEPSLDATEVSHSSPGSAREVLPCNSSHQLQVTFSSQTPTDYDGSYYSPPASCHQKRRHNRRGGFVHGSLLRSAVMASMECPDEDDARPLGSYRQNSAISLQSLQDALRETSSLASSPRKRARKVCRTKSSNANNNNEDDVNLGGLMDAMRVQDLQIASDAMPRREPPVRRVSRKTSHDSRISDFSDWDEEEEERWSSDTGDNDDNPDCDSD